MMIMMTKMRIVNCHVMTMIMMTLMRLLMMMMMTMMKTFFIIMIMMKILILITIITITITRFDLFNHWPVHNELDENDKPRRRNCKMCLENKKVDQKSTFMCTKCNIPLHINCFEPYHHSW